MEQAVASGSAWTADLCSGGLGTPTQLQGTRAGEGLSVRNGLVLGPLPKMALGLVGAQEGSTVG